MTVTASARRSRPMSSKMAKIVGKKIDDFRAAAIKKRLHPHEAILGAILETVKVDSPEQRAFKLFEEAIGDLRKNRLLAKANDDDLWTVSFLCVLSPLTGSPPESLR